MTRMICELKTQVLLGNVSAPLGSPVVPYLSATSAPAEMVEGAVLDLWETQHSLPLPSPSSVPCPVHC